MLSGKFTIVTRDDSVSENIASKLKTFLIANFLQEDKDKPDYVFVVGGDGTVLRSVGKYIDLIDDVKFLSIHTGHLGFYTDYSVQNFEKIFEDMLTKKPKVEKYPLLQVDAYCGNKKLIDNSYCLNEVTINDVTNATYVAEVYINGSHFENFRGDGLCISTPTGSTAYNKSLGGAVIHPKMDVYQVAEIAAINNLVYRTLGNSIVLSKEDVLTIVPANIHNNRLNVDYKNFTYDTISKIVITLAENKKISFLRFNNVDFWKRVKRSFIGNE